MPDWLSEAIARIGSDPLLQGTLAALATFILEDPTTIGCGLLVADGRMAFLTAFLGVSVGIACVNVHPEPLEKFNGFYAACSTYGSFVYLKYGPMRLFSQLAQNSVGFLPGRLNEAAGVDQQYGRLLGFLNPQPASLLQEAVHHLAVHQVFGAAEADHADFPGCAHDSPGPLGPGDYMSTLAEVVLGHRDVQRL